MDREREETENEGERRLLCLAVVSDDRSKGSWIVVESQIFLFFIDQSKAQNSLADIMTDETIPIRHVTTRNRSCYS